MLSLPTVPMLRVLSSLFSNSFLDVCFHPYDNILASASYDMTVKVFKELGGEWECVQTLTGHTDTVWCIQWSPDGKRLASAGSDNCVRVWVLKDGRLELESNIQGLHERTIYSIDWSHKGIITGCADNSVRLLVESDDGWVCRDSVSGRSDINCVAWSKSATRIAAGSDEGEILLIDLIE